LNVGGRESRGRVFWILALAVLAPGWGTSVLAQERDSIELVDLEQHVRNIATYASASIVTVVSVHRFPSVGAAGEITASGAASSDSSRLEATVGSGIVIDRSGDIITTVSVIGEGGEYQITTAGGEVWDAELVGCDRDSRLCLLRTGAKNLRPITIGSSEDVGPGTMVIIVGRAYGNLPTVSFGAMNERHPWNVTKGTELVSMSAPVYPGNNGGAVLNFSGELIGVVSGTLGGFKSDETGSVVKVPPELPDIASPSQDAQMSFAITVETLKKALPRMRMGGEAKSAYFGVRVAAAPGETSEQGVVISDVVPHSPAEVAGLRGGDVIFRYDGTGVTSAEQLINLVRRSESGSTVQVVYRRDGSLNTAQVILTEISPYQLKLVEQKLPQRQAGR
jgi:S1-C subfamily serine protease